MNGVYVFAPFMAVVIAVLIVYVTVMELTK